MPTKSEVMAQLVQEHPEGFSTVVDGIFYGYTPAKGQAIDETAISSFNNAHTPTLHAWSVEHGRINNVRFELERAESKGLNTCRGTNQLVERMKGTW